MRGHLLVVFIEQNMLHAGPEIHRQRTHLNFHLHPALSFEQCQGYRYDNVEALVSVRLRTRDIIFNFDNRYVLSAAQMIQQAVNIFNERKHDTHPGDIVDFVYHVVHRHLQPFALQLF
ncbi:hypothetical protein D3C77_449410 [compost metagenome]